MSRGSLNAGNVTLKVYHINGVTYEFSQHEILTYPRGEDLEHQAWRCSPLSSPLPLSPPFRPSFGALYQESWWHLVNWDYANENLDLSYSYFFDSDFGDYGNYANGKWEPAYSYSFDSDFVDTDFYI